jgi:hypothetical protein
MWFALLGVAFGFDPSRPLPSGHDHTLGGLRLTLFAGVTFALWVIAIAAESGIAYGVARFLVRVRPDLLPGPRRGSEGAGGPRSDT